MTDEEVRARLAKPRGGDVCSRSIVSLNCLQMGGIFLYLGTGTDLRSWCGYFVLGVLPVAWLIPLIVRRRDARKAPEVVRRKYEDDLAQRIVNCRAMRYFIWIWIGIFVVTAGTTLANGGGGDATGTALWIMCVLFATDWYYQSKKVLPLLEREQAEYREAVVA